jgi:hypothetical protein
MSLRFLTTCGRFIGVSSGAEFAHRSLTDSGAFVEGGGRNSSGAEGFPHREGFALAEWELETTGGSGGSDGEEADTRLAMASCVGRVGRHRARRNGAQ